MAQKKALGVWVNFKQEQPNKSAIKDFAGKVVEVHSGDSLTVLDEDNSKLHRLYLATVKAPKFSNKDNDSEPYAWESKEQLRKLTIGKKVNVVMEYARQTQEGKTMDHCSITVQKTDKNVSIQLLEKGLLETNLRKNGDNASKCLEDLLAAEKIGIDRAQGIHSKK